MLTPSRLAALERAIPKQLDIRAPRPGSTTWQVRNKGLAGVIGLPDGTVIRLEPKIPLPRLVEYILYANGASDFRLRDKPIPMGSMEEAFDALAQFFAQGVLQRARRGLHREYVPRTERLGSIRGRVVTRDLAARPVSRTVLCRHHHRTADIAENRALRHTTHTLLARGELDPNSTSATRQAERRLAQDVPLPREPQPLIVQPQYTRMTQDYAALHHLAGFLLDATAPATSTGEFGGQKFPPFVVDMASLFQRVVTRSLRDSLAATHSVTSEETRTLSQDPEIRFRADIVLRTKAGAAKTIVLDTKYKAAEKGINSSDVAQAAAYALEWEADVVALVHPGSAELHSKEIRVGPRSVWLARADWWGPAPQVARQVAKEVRSWVLSPGVERVPSD